MSIPYKEDREQVEQRETIAILVQKVAELEIVQERTLEIVEKSDELIQLDHEFIKRLTERNARLQDRISGLDKRITSKRSENSRCR